MILRRFLTPFTPDPSVEPTSPTSPRTMVRTRLSVEPSRRVDYREAPGTARNPIIVDDLSPSPQLTVPRPDYRPDYGMLMPSVGGRQHTPPPAPPARQSRPSGREQRREQRRERSGGVMKVSQPKKDKKDKKDCMLCAESKTIGSLETRCGFTVLPEAKLCDHFMDTCNTCVSKLVKSKISDRDLSDAALACPVPGCTHQLEFATVAKLIPKTVSEQWECALTNRFLCENKNTIACLNSKCGRYFSIEDCGTIHGVEREERDKAECPYCAYEHCLKCNRPWHSETSCDKYKDFENKLSENTIKMLGAKPCPNCGAQIEKNGGCNHMHCKRCKHDFCFSCLATYKAKMSHAPGCPELPRNMVELNNIPYLGYHLGNQLAAQRLHGVNVIGPFTRLDAAPFTPTSRTIPAFVPAENRGFGERHRRIGDFQNRNGNASFPRPGITYSLPGVPMTPIGRSANAPSRGENHIALSNDRR